MERIYMVRKIIVISLGLFLNVMGTNYLSKTKENKKSMQKAIEEIKNNSDWSTAIKLTMLSCAEISHDIKFLPPTDPLHVEIEKCRYHLLLDCTN